MSMEDKFETALEEIVHDMSVLLKEKFRMYGNENILQDGTEGVYVRMKDKFNRLGNCMKGRVPVNTESEYDTWLDVAGYAIIGMMLKRHMWPGQEPLRCVEDRPTDSPQGLSAPIAREPEKAGRQQCDSISVYVAGPTDMSNCYWLLGIKSIVEGYRNRITCFFPQGSYHYRDGGNAQFVKDVNYLALTQSQAVLVVLPKSEFTVGTIFELVWALQLNKPVVVVTNYDVIPVYLINPLINVFSKPEDAIEFLLRGK